MAKTSPVGDRFREELRTARVRAGWSQAQLAEVCNERYGMGIHGSGIAKIEAGDRDVRIGELAAFADLFGASTDAMLGRQSGENDVLWAASKLSTNAQKAVADVVALKNRTSDDAQDLWTYAERDGKQAAAKRLVDLATTACAALEDARIKLIALSTEFPLPGVSLDRG